VPWFRNDVPSPALADDLAGKTAGTKPFMMVMGQDSQFGHNKDKTASLVVVPSPIIAVEQTVRQALKAHDSWLVDETTRHKRTFTPHVTTQPNERLQPGDVFICDKLYIIEQKGGHKLVSGIVEL
jgi:hypothetical protein